MRINSIIAPSQRQTPKKSPSNPASATNRALKKIRNALFITSLPALLAACETTNEPQNALQIQDSGLQDSPLTGDEDSTALSDTSDSQTPTDSANTPDSKPHPDAPEPTDSSPPSDSNWEGSAFLDAPNCATYPAGTNGSPTTTTFSAIENFDPQNPNEFTSIVSAVFSPSEGHETSNSWADNEATFSLSSSSTDLYPLVYSFSAINGIKVDLNSGTSQIFEIDKQLLAEALKSIPCDPADSMYTQCIDTKDLLITPDHTYAPYGQNIWTLSQIANMTKCSFNLPNGINCHLYDTPDAGHLQNLFTSTAHTGSFQESYPNQTKIFIGLNDCDQNQ